MSSTSISFNDQTEISTPDTPPILIDNESVDITVDNVTIDSSDILSQDRPPIDITTENTSLRLETKEYPSLSLKTSRLYSLGISSSSTPSPTLSISSDNRREFSFEINRPETVIIQQTPPPIFNFNNPQYPLTIILSSQARITAIQGEPTYNVFMSAEDIEEKRVVYVDKEGEIRRGGYHLEDEEFLAIRGILINSVYAGSRGQVQIEGEMFYSHWEWTPDLPVYLGAEGQLTQEVPTSRVILEIGYALTPQSILIDLEEPTIIED